MIEFSALADLKDGMVDRVIGGQLANMAYATVSEQL
jgi:hypothetical protein